MVANQTPQPSEGVTAARKVHPRDAALDWAALTADQIDRLSRSVGDLWPLSSRIGTYPVGLRGFASPSELRELRRTVPLPESAPPGTPVFDKRCPEVVFVRCKDWTAWREIRIGRSTTAQHWLTALEFYNGYLAKPAMHDAVFESAPCPLFRKRHPEMPRPESQCLETNRGF